MLPLFSNCVSAKLTCFQLNSIDNMRVDGKFMVGNDIPEGQGNVTELLAECFDINYELRVAAEELEEAERVAPAPQPIAS